MANQKWVVARHGPVDAKGLCYGQTDVRPTLSAEDAATRVEAQLSQPKFDRIITSPWTRTRPVAETLGQRWQVPVTVEPRLSEMHFGTWEGKSFKSIGLKDPVRWADWMANWKTEAPPGGESLKDFVGRVRDWLLRETVPSRTFLFLHGGVIQVFWHLTEGASMEELIQRKVPHLVTFEFTPVVVAQAT